MPSFMSWFDSSTPEAGKPLDDSAAGLLGRLLSLEEVRYIHEVERDARFLQQYEATRASLGRIEGLLTEFVQAARARPATGPIVDSFPAPVGIPVAPVVATQSRDIGSQQAESVEPPVADEAHDSQPKGVEPAAPVAQPPTKTDADADDHDHDAADPAQPPRDKVFISYCWKNSKAQVEKDVQETRGSEQLIKLAGLFDPRDLARDITSTGKYRAWLDINELGIGRQGELFENLAHALVNEAAIVVAHISDEYAASKNCKREFQFASNHNIEIIPVIVGATDAMKKEVYSGSNAPKDPKLPSWRDSGIGIQICNDLYKDAVVDKPEVAANRRNELIGIIHEKMDKIMSERRRLEANKKKTFQEFNTLWEAAEVGDIRALQFIVGRSPDFNINESNPVNDMTALHYAAKSNNKEICEYLIRFRAKVNLRTNEGKTAMFLAAEQGHVDIVNFLLSKDADPDIPDNSSNTPFSVACQNPHIEVAKALLANPMLNISVRNNLNEMAIHHACASGETEIVQILLDRGCSLYAKTSTSMTPLLCAVAEGHVDIVKLLVERGASLKDQDNNGYTPLMLAAFEGQLKVVEYLTSIGCTVVQGFATNQDTALHLAADAGHLDIVKFLLDHDRSLVDLSGESGYTPVMTAARTSGHVDIVRTLISDYNADLEKLNTYGETTLLRTLYSNPDVETLTVLLDAGANVHAIDNTMWDAALCACLDPNIEVFKLILARGASLRGINTNGYTVFNYSPAHNNFSAELAKLLIEHLRREPTLPPEEQSPYTASIDALLNLSACRNKPPLLDTLAAGNLSVSEEFINAGARLDVTDDDFQSAFLAACKGGNLEAVKLVLSKGGDCNAINGSGSNGLLEACSNTDSDPVDLVRYLLEQVYPHYGSGDFKPEILVNRINYDGDAPLHSAARSLGKNTVRYLLTKGANPNQINSSGQTPLTLVTQRDYSWGSSDDDSEEANASVNAALEIVKHLLNAGANINHELPDGSTPLLTALGSGLDKVAIHLMDHGAALDAVDNQGNDAFMNACSGSSVATMQKVLESGAKRWSVSTLRLMTPLHIAVDSGDIDTVKYVVENCLEGDAEARSKLINLQDTYGDTPLTSAVSSSYWDIALYLVENGADVEHKNALALHEAARSGELKLVSAILERRKDCIDRRDNTASTPLLTAATAGVLEVVKLLVEAGADTTVRDQDQSDLFLCACTSGNLAVVRYCADKSADLYRCTVSDRSAVHIAVAANDASIVEFVTEKLAKDNPDQLKKLLDQLSDDDRTPLLQACADDMPDAVFHLLKHGADPNRDNSSGTTPLMMAAQCGSLRTVERLLKNPAVDIDVKSDEGFTALHYAITSNNVDIFVKLFEVTSRPIEIEERTHILTSAYSSGSLQLVELIVSKELDPWIRDSDGNGSLALAAQSNSLDLVQYLLKRDKSPKDLVQETNASGMTPLMVACQANVSASIARALVEAGADVNATDDNGNTPLFHAVCAQASISLIRYLVNEAHANVHATNNSKSTPCLEAVSYGYDAAVVFFLHKGADVTVQDNEGHSMLVYACSSGNLGLVKILLDHGAPLDRLYTNGYHSIMAVAETPRLDLLKLLLSHEAARPLLTKTDANNLSPVIKASAQYGGMAVVDYLLSQGANPNDSDTDGTTVLIYATQKKCLPLVQKLVKTYNVDIDAKDSYGNTALIHAIQNNDLLIIQLLVESGANIQVRNLAGDDPLITACRSASLAVVKFLVGSGVQLDAKNIDSETALLIAVRENQPKAASFLLGLDRPELDSVIDGSDRQGNTPLFHTIINTNPSLYKLLRSKGAKLDVLSSDGTSMLIQAVRANSMEMIDMILEDPDCTNLNHHNNDGTTALLAAANLSQPNEPLIRRLIEKGADIHALDNDKRGLFYWTSATGIVSLIKIAVDAGVDVTQRADAGITGLHMAVQSGNLQAVQYLLGIDKVRETINVADDNGSTALIFAASSLPAAVDVLLESGADVNAVTSAGRTPLMMACESQLRLGFNSILRDSRTDVNHRDENGDSALLIAATCKTHNYCEALLERGAEIDIRNNSGNTVFLNAVSSGTIELIQLVVERGARVTDVNEQGETGLLIAVGSGNLDVLRYVLEHCTKHDAGLIDQADHEGTTPLMSAAANGNLGVVKFLLEKGANAGLVNSQGKTALMIACQNGERDIAEVLCPTSKSVIDHFDASNQSALFSAISVSDLGLVRLLVTNGASLEAQDATGVNPFMHACSLGNLSVVMYLAKTNPASANSKVVSPEGETALLRAVKNKSLDVAQYLIDIASDDDLANLVNQGDQHGVTPLLSAAQDGSAYFATLLLDKGADINHVDDQNESALLKSAAADSLDIVKVLLERGIADIHARSSATGMTPLFAAVSSGSFHTMHILVERGATIDDVDKDGNNLFMTAIGSNTIRMVEEVAKLGAPLNQPNNLGETCLMKAVATNIPAIVEFVLKTVEGLDVNHKTEDGRCAMTIAKENEDEAIIEMLRAFGAQDVEIPEHADDAEDDAVDAADDDAADAPAEGATADAADAGDAAVECATADSATDAPAVEGAAADAKVIATGSSEDQGTFATEA
ncbi:ankyrin repeat-containing domain protein [Polychytrium aggregatum]|uniref:ankyrin repeat-containing domain protein n=1 Tax=Polychytrium aggregatum TaxID=110093 RepID=UPI0022FE272B|nr:ankyrin repeat-containing domain protein [Polychytrium aggregatum]KAI9207399.1 ankyrin repeat-containing domain protein [Polychytrium aggregatum]